MTMTDALDLMGRMIADEGRTLWSAANQVAWVSGIHAGRLEAAYMGDGPDMDLPAPNE